MTALISLTYFLPYIYTRVGLRIQLGRTNVPSVRGAIIRFRVLESFVVQYSVLGKQTLCLTSDEWRD
jgi:hypothetical protein